MSAAAFAPLKEPKKKKKKNLQPGNVNYFLESIA